MRLSAIAGVLSSEDGGFGEVFAENIPEKQVCPQCGEDATNGGECLVSFVYLINPVVSRQLPDQSGAVLTVVADCRTCGYYGPGPTAENLFNKHKGRTSTPRDYMSRHCLG